jgi:hypothetical protein
VKLKPSWSLRFNLGAASAYVLALAWSSDDDPGGSVLSAQDEYVASNGTTTVTLAAAPSSGDSKIVDGACWRNTDSIAHTVNVILHDGTNERVVCSPSVPAGHVLWYTRGGSPLFYVTTADLRTPADTDRPEDGRTISIYKSGTAAEAAGSYYCTAKDGGFPGAITVGTPGLSGRAVYGSTEGGAITQILGTPTGYWHLTGAAISSSVVHSHMIFDLLWINSGIVVTTTTAQTVTSATLPPRDINGGTAGAGCGIGLLFTAAATNASAISGSTVSYTNSDGTSGRTATLVAVAGSQIPATPVVGTLVWFALAAGDTGVQSIESITLGTSLVTGSVSLIIARPIAMAPSVAANIPGPCCIEPKRGICLWSDPALFHCYIASATTATATAGTLHFSDLP